MDPATFAYHPPTEEQKRQLDNVQAAFNSTLQVIEANVPEGRYRATAITDLEKAGAMAAKGIFKNNDGSARVTDAA